MSEEWRPVHDYEGFYEVSDLGRFRRVGAGQGAVAGRLVSTGRRNAKGYVVIEFCRADQKRRLLAHQVVARAFIGEPPSPTHGVNHIDGVKTNNSATNLEWSTRAENNAHAKRIGLLRPLKGEANGRAKLTEADVAEIRLNPGGCSQRALAKRFGVARTLIQRIQQGKAWKPEVRA